MATCKHARFTLRSSRSKEPTVKKHRGRKSKIDAAKLLRAASVLMRELRMLLPTALLIAERIADLLNGA